MVVHIGVLGDEIPHNCAQLAARFTVTTFDSLDALLDTDHPLAAVVWPCTPSNTHAVAGTHLTDDSDTISPAAIGRLRASTTGLRLPILLITNEIADFTSVVGAMGTGRMGDPMVDFCSTSASSDEVDARVAALVDTATALLATEGLEDRARLLAFHERVLDSISDLIAVVTQDGSHLLFNRAAREMCKVPESVPTASIDAVTLTPPDTLSFLSAEVFPAMRRDGSWAGRSELLATDGERIPVWQQWFTITDPEGNQVLTGTHARDLRESDRLLRELGEMNSALAINTHRFDAIMKTTPDLAAFARSNGEVFELNPAGRELLGIGATDDLNDLHLLDIHPEDLAQFARTVAMPHALRHGSWSGETSIIRTDGSTVPVWQVLMAIPEVDSDDITFVTFVRDLGDLRTLQSQVDLAQEARARAEAAELAKSRFLANMSHEIRTPLNAVLGYAQLLEMDNLSHEQSESVRSIRRAGSHLLALINDVLDLSRIEAGASTLNPQPTDLHLLLAEIKTMFDRECTDRGLGFTMTVDLPQPDWVFADRQRLTQAISNLLDNALKFTEEGEISLVARRRIDGETVFEVADTGTGMTVSELTNVFAPFTQGTSGSIFGGSGLGLSITRNLVDMMKGNIRMSLRPQGGVKAVISLPLLSSERASEPEMPFGTTIDTSGFDGITAIVVDDVDDNRTVLTNLLKRHSVTVSEASNGLELLALLETHEPDVVFLDIRMPEMDGHSALQEAKTRWPDRETVYVAVTATGIATTRATYLRYGFHDLIKKPFHFNEIAIFLTSLRDRLRAESHNASGQSIDVDAVATTAADLGTDSRAESLPRTDGVAIDVRKTDSITQPPAGMNAESTSASRVAIPTASTNKCSVPEPFRQQLIEAAELGRVIQLRRVLTALGAELADGGELGKRLDPTEISAIAEAVHYIKSLADSYDLERMVTYLTD